MTANTQRGDVALTLDGEDYTMALTFAAIASIENRLNTGIIGVLGRFVRSEAGYRDAEAVIIEATKAGGQKAPSNLRALIAAEGLLRISAPLTTYLTNAVTGVKPPDESAEPAGEAKAEA
jgi:Phage tail tube protein, GTA-gp10